MNFLEEVAEEENKQKEADETEEKVEEPKTEPESEPKPIVEGMLLFPIEAESLLLHINYIIFMENP